MKICRNIFILLTILVLLLATCNTQAPDSKMKKCVNQNKEEVDWYVIFLFPQTCLQNQKLSYAYYDNSSEALKYFEVDEKKFPPLLMTSEGNQDSKEKAMNYFYWNDDSTLDEGEKTSSSSGKAHSKGGLAYNANSGVYLLHSLPRFPNRKENGEILYTLPDNAGKFGQTFICISMDKDNSLKVIETLNIINPSLLINSKKDNVDKTPNEQVEKLIKNRQDSSLPLSQITKIKSRKGETFDIFSKGKNNPDLPYDSAMPEEYKDGFYVETWTRPIPIPSNCKQKYSIINVKQLKFGNFSFQENQEHSKWAVSIKKNICCFGDLNRTETQKKRGGNVICFKNKKLSEIMKNAIQEKEVCAKHSFLEYVE